MLFTFKWTVNDGERGWRSLLDRLYIPLRGACAPLLVTFYYYISRGKVPRHRLAWLVVSSPPAGHRRLEGNIVIPIASDAVHHRFAHAALALG